MTPQDHPLDEAAVARILGAVKGEHNIGSGMIEMAAGFYEMAKNRAAQSSGRGLKQDIRQISAQCHQLADTLDTLPLSVAIVITTVRQILGPQSERQDRLSIDDLVAELRHIAVAAGRFAQLSKGRLVRFDPTMQLTLGMLEVGYRRGTGKQATHSSHVDGQHAGQPRSEFGRLVSAFFAEVDPAITQVSLTTEVRKFISDLDIERFDDPLQPN